jgi:hypothetical protein
MDVEFMLKNMYKEIRKIYNTIDKAFRAFDKGKNSYLTKIDVRDFLDKLNPGAPVAMIDAFNKRASANS